MRKIIFLMHVSLDGFISDKVDGDGLDWIRYDDELQKISYEMHDAADAAIFGRKTYEMMDGYWRQALTNPETDPSELSHAQWLDKATKIVVSTTLKSVDWGNTILIKDNVIEEIKKLKAQEGKEMWLIASATLANTLMDAGLIDEYILNVNPVILGSGKPLFGTHKKPINLKLVSSKTLKSGTVSLRYAPDNSKASR